MFWCKVNRFLIRSHIQKCERCMSQMASREEVKALIIQESDVEDFRDLWPAIKTGVAEKNHEKKAVHSINRRWAFASVGIVAVFLAGFFLFSVFSRNEAMLDQEGEERFQINYIRVGDEPATPYLYQPKDSDLSLIHI